MKKQNRLVFWGLIATLSLALGLASLAQAAGVAPDKMLEDKSAAILDELQRNSGSLRNNPEKIRALVDKHLLPVIDFTTMSKLVLGQDWRKASEAQRADFMVVFENLLIRTYAKSIREYANVDIKFFPDRTRIRDGKFSRVYSEFVPGGGKPNVPVEYSLKNNGSQWLIYDVSIEGLSLVKSYRTSFKEEITATSLDALIARLQKSSQASSVSGG